MPTIDQKPSVGRIVHYVSYGTPGGEYKSECRAAVITAVRDLEPVPEHGVPYVDLFVMNPTGVFLNQDCGYHEGDIGHDHTGAEIPNRSYRGGSWHWPERT